LKYFLHLAIV